MAREEFVRRGTKRTTRVWVVLAERRLLVLALVSTVLGAFGSTPVAAQQSGERWIAAWRASPQPPSTVQTTPQALLSQMGFEEQTLRQVVYPTFGGAQVRLRVANTFGTQPLIIGEAHIALQAETASTAPGSDRKLTFGGSSEVTIPPGADAVSDPVALAITPLRPLAISLYLPGPTGPVTWHQMARQTLYGATGNQVANPSGTGYEPMGTSHHGTYLVGST